ncbi:MAG: hypothetical protein EOO77_00705 [Oxalobacteraceae bacterium]|nr:MAG: hypothetical protein EOO77_00705 [Oxalobacteraceae bacterium]
MIEIAPFLNSHYANIVGATGRFLEGQGVAPSIYAVTSKELSADCLFTIRYDETRFEDGDYHARILISGSVGVSVIDTGLRMALGVLRSTFDSADNVGALHDIGSKEPGAKKPQVNPADLAQDVHSGGLYLDIQRNPARLDNIEVNGQRSTLAISASADALYYLIAAIQYQARERVGQRFAAYLQ